MKCLVEDCNNEFENKTGRRRFCSDACKMKWHRKHPKKGTVTKLELQTLYNEFKSAIQNIGTYTPSPQSSQKWQDITSYAKQTNDGELTFQQHMNKIALLIFPDERQDYIPIVKSATNLSEKQKQLLIMNLTNQKG